MQRISTYMHFRAGEQAISAGQGGLLKLQAQVASGKRISLPSDDPIGAATGATLRSGLARLDLFKRNQDQATYLLNQSETAVSQFSNALLAARDKLLAANNGATSDAQRQMYASDLEGILAQMVGLANSADGLGGFLFAGTQEGAAPFAQTGNAVSFSGDDVLQKLEVSANRFLRVKFSGEDLFLKTRPGNGTFTTAAAGTNTGTAIMDPGGVVDPSQLTGSSYSIDFNGTQFVVTRASDNAQFTFAPAGNGPTTLQFDGLRVAISSTPAAGDQFSVAPAGYQSIFDTVAQAISILRAPAPTPAARAQVTMALGGLGASIDQALDHLAIKRAEIGASLSELDSYQQINSDRQFEYQGRLSAVEDVDYATAISQLSQTQSSFDAAIKSYSTVSKLSLFNYL